MSYYIISGGDGDVHCNKFADRASLLKAITADEHGDTYYGDISKLAFLTEFKDLQNLDAHEIIIIRAEVIVPKPKQVVQSFEIE